MKSRLRIIDPDLANNKGPGRNKAEHCFCGKVSREGKPLCPEHVNKMPYIQWIQLCLDSDTPGIKASKKDDLGD